jgi:hypothetical protein
VCKFANTDVYTGEWEDGLRSGRGVCIYASGEKFDGLWSCNQPLDHDYNLKATYVVPLHEGPEGQQPQGELPKGDAVTSSDQLRHMSGPASIVYPTGDKYTGQLVEGRRHGRGTYHERATGNKYEGASSGWASHACACVSVCLRCIGEAGWLARVYVCVCVCV